MTYDINDPTKDVLWLCVCMRACVRVSVLRIPVATALKDAINLQTVAMRDKPQWFCYKKSEYRDE